MFEDTIYMSTYHTYNIYRMDKFGRKNGTFLVEGLPRIADIVIVQENKQDRSSKFFLNLHILRSDESSCSTWIMVREVLGSNPETS